ncbi:ATP-dependent endonuclease [Verminephrobacter aporrectodeae subsp. tuberculatae]|uniref:ATP-dependent nuclease n=1 Tax=Verminephrobacter aporrectodeae TaxID=1110389 RepID=UPI002237DA90|nr:AAA family ATPase [Verminephrobacter aporrectodeae]MCW5223547.1 ATP-dependent endonuclease [Verminephrobacter aporrectodeae subsp. tuberculatae]MCW5289013.1 ATP-dependent endonuclease [Verminephrobacter aporrectodeae subsp. tuberculatae]
MKTITRIILSNFKRFETFELECDESLNILIGDNEAGKSSVLLALDLVLSGSRSKVEAIGLETLFNLDVVKRFLDGEKKYEDLPKLFVEIYLSEQNNADLNGKNNSKGIMRDGLRMACEPIDEYSKEIAEVLKDEHHNFPFEFYAIKFTTFADQPYSQRRPIKHLVIDSSLINNEYATREYTRSVYSAHATVLERNKHENLYRKSKSVFKSGSLGDLNEKLPNYKFAVRTDPRSNLESDLVITEQDIPINSKGKGRQCLIKTEFALMRNNAGHSLDVLLLEEPENHLSHSNMKRLIARISESEKKQLFIATHSNQICARLDLRKAVLLGKGDSPVRLKDLSEETATFFIKAPDNNVLEFALSAKVMLVEGDAEFILLDALYKKHPGEVTLEKDGVHVISVGGTSFKRYLDLAKLLGIKTAVVRDNDGDYQSNCVDRYADYAVSHIRIFSDKDPGRDTFEICFYQDNKTICDELFLPRRVKLTAQDYMLKNKTEAAFELLSKKEAALSAPAYLSEAIVWIRA